MNKPNTSAKDPFCSKPVHNHFLKSTEHVHNFFNPVPYIRCRKLILLESSTGVIFSGTAFGFWFDDDDYLYDYK